LELVFNSAVKDYDYLIQQKDVLDKAVQFATQKMKIIKTHYEQGVASVTDYNSANLELTETEMNRSGLILQIVLKLNEIEYKSGKPISEWSLAQ